jgi:nitroimidazol reductase NimA-like FMN-containing flavoprotein (pyridoxamine 5'-phosphate oxidase superfamily)
MTLTWSPYRQSMNPLQRTPRTEFGRHSERASRDRERLHQILDAATMCHVGIVVDDSPLVIPTVYGTGEGDTAETLYLHGSVASRWLTRSGQGTPVCVAVSLVDAVVLARSVFSHSVNYRSVVIFANARQVTDHEERLAGLRAVTNHVCPGQWDYARRPTAKELAATTVLALPLDEATVKVREGGPGEIGPDDALLAVWSGLVPIHTTFGALEPDTVTPPDLPIPPHLAGLVGRPVDERHTGRVSAHKV